MTASVLFLAPSAYPLGGVAQWLDYLLPGLEALGWRCTLALTQGRFHDVDAYLARHPWGKVVTVPNPTGSARGRVDALTRSIRDADPDLLVVTNVVCAYEAGRVLRLQGARAPRIAMALHGLQPDLLRDLKAERDVIDAAITVNRLMSRLAEAELCDPGRVFYAPGGAAVGTQAPPRHRAGEGPLRLLFCGRIEQRQKRVLDLVELAKLLSQQGVDFSLSLAGSGPDESVLRERITGFGLDKHFAWLGELSHPDVAREYVRHHALLITSSWETGPLVAWEAMGCGLPVLSSRYVGSGLEAALVDNNNSLLFPTGDMAAAAQAVHALLSPGVAQRVIRGGTELVRSRYTHEISVKAWSNALHGVMALPALPPPTQRVNCSLHHGRLDRWFGVVAAERLRRLLRLSFVHCEAGAEWPHSRHDGRDADEFLDRAARLDHSPMQSVHELGLSASTPELT